MIWRALRAGAVLVVLAFRYTSVSVGGGAAAPYSECNLLVIHITTSVVFCCCQESVHEEAVGMDETLQDSPEMPLTQPDPDKRVNEEEADEDGDGDGGNEESGSGSGSDGGDISMTVRLQYEVT